MKTLLFSPVTGVILILKVVNVRGILFKIKMYLGAPG